MATTRTQQFAISFSDKTRDPPGKVPGVHAWYLVHLLETSKSQCVHFFCTNTFLYITYSLLLFHSIWTTYIERVQSCVIHHKRPVGFKRLHIPDLFRKIYNFHDLRLMFRLLLFVIYLPSFLIWKHSCSYLFRHKKLFTDGKYTVNY